MSLKNKAFLWCYAQPLGGLQKALRVRLTVTDLVDSVPKLLCSIVAIVTMPSHMKKLTWIKFNRAQQQILGALPGLLLSFVQSEWRKCALGFGSGALCGAFATLIRMYADDHQKWALDNPHLAIYRAMVNTDVHNLWFVFVPLALIALVKIASVGQRAARSWFLGVTSGAFVWPFAIALAAFWDFPGLSTKREYEALGISCIFMLLAFALRVSSQIAQARTLVAPGKILAPTSLNSNVLRDPESPIDSWVDDQLGRLPLVEMLALKILVSKTPVIAIRGHFGDGKSSVLNLLRSQLGRRAVVVSFSSWLPDSHQTLVKDLFGDVAAEISKCYIVPGLRKRLVKFASLLGGTVPYLKLLPDVLPPYTQREEIQDLGVLLGRIPKRVVVLLDEIDRMQKEEMLTLLKVMRGVFALPNLTFVCAFQQEEFERTVCGSYDSSSHEFMEKFFPTAIDLPQTSTETLERILRDQVLESLDKANWFTGAEDRNDFLKKFENLYTNALISLCTNIRKIRLLANDLHAVAVLVTGEVDPLDLCTLEAVRRFYPKAYELIWKNPFFFCKSGSW